MADDGTTADAVPDPSVVYVLASGHIDTGKDYYRFAPSIIGLFKTMHEAKVVLRAEIRDYYGRDVRSWYREAWLDVRSEGPAASDEDSEDADGEEIESRLDEENLRFEQCLAALEADAPLADAQFEFGVAWGFTPERNGPDWCERWAADYGNVTMGMELSGSRCISSWSISQAPNIML